jgi:hypothetical protein
MNTLTMNQWYELLKNKPISKIEETLQDTLKEIKFLESIYTTGGELNYFSKQFSDSAYREREYFCQLSSACYKLLRELRP